MILHTRRWMLLLGMISIPAIVLAQPPQYTLVDLGSDPATALRWYPKLPKQTYENLASVYGSLGGGSTFVHATNGEPLILPNSSATSPPALGNDSTGFGDPSFVVGESVIAISKWRCAGEHHAFIWKREINAPATLTDLGVLPGGCSSGAYGFNNKGQVVGYSQSAFAANLSEANEGGAAHAVLWSNGAIEDLGNFVGMGDFHSAARAINDSGEIVGWSQIYINNFTAVARRAFLYTGGKMMNLQFLLAEAPNILLVDATQINCKGNISAIGYPVNTPAVAHNYLLVRQGPARNCSP